MPQNFEALLDRAAGRGFRGKRHAVALCHHDRGEKQRNNQREQTSETQFLAAVHDILLLI
jgi:hypothetical protein